MIRQITLWLVSQLRTQRPLDFRELIARMQRGKSYQTGEKKVNYTFHLLIKIIPHPQFTDEQIQKRFEIFFDNSREFAAGQTSH